MVEITEEQRKKMQKMMEGPLGGNAKILTPIFMQVLENMTEKEVCVLIESAEDLMNVQKEVMEEKKEVKDANPWFQ